ncbi:hypothetical protein Neosp_013175 [[Neocosmospora] mangrovei]
MASANEDAVPASLDRLPSETLLAIFKLFCWHCRDEEIQHDMTEASEDAWTSWHTLEALSQTSRRLRSIAQPIQYHDPNAYLRLSDLLYRIDLDLSLAKHVKVLRLGDLENEMDEPGDANLALKVARKFGMRIEGGRNYFTHSGKRLLSHPTLHGPFCDQLLIALCTKVEMIAMQLSSFHDKQKYWKLAETHRRTYGSATNLNNLRHVTFWKRGAELFSIYHPGVGTVLRVAPALETLVLVETQWVEPYDKRSSAFDVRVFAPALRNLTSLQLINSIVPEDHMDVPWEVFCKVIEMTKSLKHFVYLARCIDHQNWHFGGGRFLEALKPQAETLEILEVGSYDLDCSYQNNGVFGLPFINRSNLGPFRNLHTLRLLELTFCRHFDLEAAEKFHWNCISDFLLPNIKHLAIGLDTQWRVARKDVTGFGKDVVAGKFPNLESFHVFLTFGRQDHDQTMRWAKCKSANLQAKLDKAFRGSSVKVSMFPEGGYCSEFGPDYTSDRSSEDSSDDESDRDDEHGTGSGSDGE